MTEARIDSDHDSAGRWIVEFTDLRVRNEDQRRADVSLNRRALFSVLEVWLRIATPGAQIIE